MGALLLIAVAGYSGFKLGQIEPSNNRNQFNMAGAPGSQSGMKSGARGGVGFGGGMLSGDILKKDSQSLTLQLRDGGSKIVWFATSTEVSKMTTGSLDDLISGKTVTVNGMTNPDGSLAAKSIQIRPIPLTNR